MAALKAGMPAKYHPQLDEYVRPGRSVSAAGRIVILVDYFENLELTLRKKPTIVLGEGIGSVDSNGAAASV